ncbi:MAG: hypothetical protein LR015_13595 [Verrucomicrobia bacterium]|nr:hypothetical protein [Verrucomicrobiota bacterium]
METKQQRENSLTVTEILDRVFAVKSGATVSPLPGASRKPRPLRDATLDNLRRFYAIAKEAIGGYHSADLTTEIAKRELSKAFRADSTFDSAISHLRPAFSFAVKAGWAPHNPLAGIQREHTPSDEIEVLHSHEEALAVIAACRDYRNDSTMPENLKVDATDALPAFLLMIFAAFVRSRCKAELGRRLTE